MFEYLAKVLGAMGLFFIILGVIKKRNKIGYLLLEA